MKNPLFILLLIVCISAFFSAICIHDGHAWGDDHALYIEQAQAINNGKLQELYNINKVSMDNSLYDIGPYLYPNGFPLLLSPITYFRGVDFISMKILCTTFFVFSLPLIYLLFNPCFQDEKYVLFITAVVAFHPFFSTFSNFVYSDFPFLFFLLLCFYLIQQKQTWYFQVLLGILIYFAYTIRDIGIVLLPVLFIFQSSIFFRGQSKSKELVKFFIPYAIFFAFFLTFYIYLPHGGSNHFAMFEKTNMMVILGNIYRYFFLTLSYITLSENNKIITLILAPFLLYVLFLGMKHSRQTYWHFIVFIGIVFVVLLCWPADYQGIRFIFPILPFILFFLIKGVEHLFTKFEINAHRANIALIVYLTILSYFNIRDCYRHSKIDFNQCYDAEMKDIYSFIAKNIDKNTVIAFKKPRILRLFTNRNTIFSDLSFFEKSVASFLLIEKQKYSSGVGSNHKFIYETTNYYLISK